jgi:SAM-dependent methyltransferase
MKCIACQHVGDDKIHEVREMLHGFRDVFKYQECRQCGTLHIKDPPADLAKYYPNDYYSYDDKAVASRPLLSMLAGARDANVITSRGLIGGLINRLKPETLAVHPLRALHGLDLTKAARILDVGCGSGQLLYRLRCGGFRHVIGIDPFLAADIHYANGLTIQKKSLSEIQGRQWDVIMMHHSFEHMPDPDAALTAVSSILAKDGYCLIRIPTISSYAWTHYGVHWASVDAPRHFTLFSRDGFKVLAKRQGFDVVREYDDSGPFQFQASEMYTKGIPWRDRDTNAEAKELFSKENHTHFERRARELNAVHQGDQVAFLLQKSRS